MVVVVEVVDIDLARFKMARDNIPTKRLPQETSWSNR